MNILTLVPVTTSAGVGWPGTGGQLRPGGCCHEAGPCKIDLDSETGPLSPHPPSNGDWASTERLRMERRNEDTLETRRSVLPS